MPERHTPKVFGEPVIGRSRLAAYIEATGFDVLHDELLTVEEKVIALHALGKLARHLSAEWRRTQRFYNDAGERYFYRLCGLAPDAGPTPEMLSRIGEVTP